MSSKLTTLFCACICIIMAAGVSAMAAETTTVHEFPPIEWSFQGKPIPETHWSPWIPLGAQEIFRLKLGFRFSDGTIGLKCPVKLTMKYDLAKAKSGEDMAIKIKPELLSPNYNTFESAFGISLPNKLQIGFFGVSGLPSFLPWWDLPMDFWELVANVPKVGSSIASAEDNIGVNTSTRNKLPLGATDSYHNQRDLISVDMTDLADQYKSQLAPKVVNKLRAVLGEDGMDSLIEIIKYAKNFNEEQAVTFLTDLCGKFVDKAAGLASLTLQGDPYFSVEGVNLRVNGRCFIPGGKGSADFVLYYTAHDQEQTVTFRDITPFVEPGDKLTLIIDSMTYEFRLRQGLNAKVKVSVVPVNLDSVEKVVSYTQATRQFTDSEFKLEIPLSPSDALIQGLRANPGCVSASVAWASPTLPIKGTVKAYSGNTLVKTTTESTYRNSHNVIVTGLQNNTPYRFEVEGVGSDGTSCPVKTIEATTVSNCQRAEETSSIAATNKYSAFNLTNLTVTAGTNYVDFSWTTNTPGSTEVLISPSPDLSANYVACVRKIDGTVVQGWVTRNGERKIETTHTMRVSDLDPGTLYYYNAKSWRFESDDPTKNPTFAVGKIGQVTTIAAPEPPSARVRVGGTNNTPVAEIPVIITRSGDPSFRLVLTTGQDGFTPVATLEAGKTYSFAVKDNLYYQDASAPALNVPANAVGSMGDHFINLTAKPSPGAYVYDTQGAPLGSTTVVLVGKSRQTLTDAAGHYTFDGLNFTGPVTVEVSRSNYVTAQVPGKVEVHSGAKVFTAQSCVLASATATLNVTVKKIGGGAIQNATLTFTEGTTPKGTLQTSSQGKVAFTCNYNDSPAVHNLTVTVTPPAGSKILPVTSQASVVGGTQQSLDIDCPEDTQGPVVSQLAVTKPNATTLGVSFVLSEDGVFHIEATKPDGYKIINTWTTNYAKSGTVNFTIAGGGTYKFKVTAKDRLGNQSVGSEIEYVIFAADQWGLRTSALTGNSATITWNKYPTAADFKSYQLNVVQYDIITGGAVDKGRKTVQSSDINAQTVQLPNLSAGCRYGATISAMTKAGTTSPAATINFTPPSLAPQINNLAVVPGSVFAGQEQTISATVTDDSAIRWIAIFTSQDTKTSVFEKKYETLTTSVPLSQKVTFPKEGKYTIIVQAKDEDKAVEKTIVIQVKAPATGEATEDKPVTPVEGEKPVKDVKTKPIIGEEKAEKAAEMEKSEEAVKEEKVVEQAQQSVDEKVVTGQKQGDLAMADLKIGESPAVGKPLAIEVGITNNSDVPFDNVQVTLIVAGKKVEAKSLPLKEKEAQTLAFEYIPQKEGTFTVKVAIDRIAGFKDTNLKNNTLTGKIIVAAGLPVADVRPEETKPLQQGGDLVLSDLKLDPEPVVGKEMTVGVAVKNDSAVDLTGVSVEFFAGSKRIDPKTPVDLKGGQSTVLTVPYTPVKAGVMAFRVHVTAPKGFKDANTKNNTLVGKVEVK